MADAMLRDRIKAELKAAMKAREQRKTATLRLISAALKDRMRSPSTIRLASRLSNTG